MIEVQATNVAKAKSRTPAIRAAGLSNRSPSVPGANRRSTTIAENSSMKLSGTNRSALTSPPRRLPCCARLSGRAKALDRIHSFRVLAPNSNASTLGDFQPSGSWKIKFTDRESRKVCQKQEFLARENWPQRCDGNQSLTSRVRDRFLSRGPNSGAYVAATRFISLATNRDPSLRCDPVSNTPRKPWPQGADRAELTGEQKRHRAQSATPRPERYIQTSMV